MSGSSGSWREVVEVYGHDDERFIQYGGSVQLQYCYVLQRDCTA